MTGSTTTNLVLFKNSSLFRSMADAEAAEAAARSNAHDLEQVRDFASRTSEVAKNAHWLSLCWTQTADGMQDGRDFLGATFNQSGARPYNRDISLHSLGCVLPLAEEDSLFELAMRIGDPSEVMPVPELITANPQPDPGSKPEPIKPEAPTRPHAQKFERVLAFEHASVFGTKTEALKVAAAAHEAADGRDSIRVLDSTILDYPDGNRHVVILAWVYGPVKGGFRSDGERFIERMLDAIEVLPVLASPVTVLHEEKEEVA